MRGELGAELADGQVRQLAGFVRAVLEAEQSQWIAVQSDEHPLASGSRSRHRRNRQGQLDIEELHVNVP
jgi:hypothetical protein